MKDNSKKETKTIDDFAGFEDTSENFFGERDLMDPIEEEKEDAKSKSEEDDKTDKNEEERKDSKKTPKKKEDEKEDEDVDFFKEPGSESEEEDDDEEEEGDDKKDKSKNKSESLKTLEYLKNQGLVDYEDEDLEGLDEETLLQDKWEESLEGAVKEMTDTLPEEVKNLIRFTSKGGDPQEYFRTLSNVANSSVNKNSDISDVRVQKESVAQDLKMQGYDDEYIQNHIETLESNKKLQEMGEKAYDRIVTKQEEAEAQKIKDIEAANKDKKDRARKFKTDLKSFVSDIKDVKGISFSAKDKRELPDYISDPKVELEDGRKISQLQADLFKVMGDKEKLTLLSKLVKSDFDFSSIEKGAISKDSKQRKQNLRNEEPSKKGSAPKNKSKKPIWELID